MNTKIFWFIKIILVGSMFTLAYIMYPYLPDPMPTHWNFEGVADGYSSKSFGVFLLPVIALAMLILFPFVRKIDPRRERFQQFEKVWEVIQISIILFMAYMQCVTFYITTHPQVSMGFFMMIGLGVLFVLLGNYMGKIRQNYTVGIRVPWTIDNEEVWNKTHRVGGWCFVISGLVFIINAYFNWQVPWVFIGAMIVAVVVPIAYSYVIFKRLKK